MAEKISNDITAQVKKDKETHLLRQLEAITSCGYKWDGLKRLRAKFTPSFTKFKDADGNYIPHEDYPHKAAEYLSTIQRGGSSSSNAAPPAPSRAHIPLQNGSFVVDDSHSRLMS